MNENTERDLSAQNSWLLGLTVGAAALAPFEVMGQTAAEPAMDLPTIDVQGAFRGNTLHAETGIARLPATVRETPKTVNVVPREIIEQQRVTTLEQALRNVPGITLSTGEGNGGQNGDQFRIRGLTSKGDVYIDGLRDFGVYTRDAFNTESVQVIKGPSGESFGVGNLGGLINQSTKKARLGSFLSVDQGIGSGPTFRTTVDGNYQINDTTAIRVNGVYHNQDVADRKHVKSDRTGLAIDFGTGIGTGTEWHLNYSYLHGDNVPDMGVPMLQAPDGIYRPIMEYRIPGLKRSTSYVRSHDKDVTNTHVLTSTFSSKLTDWFTISNDTRLSFYDRDFAATNPAACVGACATAILSGRNAALSYGAGGGMAYQQDGWAIQNVLTGKAEFDTFGLRHKLLVGLDANYQKDERSMGSWVGRTNDQTIIGPRFSYPGVFINYGATRRNAEASNLAAFVSDRIWLTQQFSLQGSLRWDYFHSEFANVPYTFGGSAQSRKFSPAISAIWEPTRNTTFYASYSRTYRPIGADISTSVSGVASEVPQRGVLNEPERADVYELGGKIDLLDGKLGLTGAVFHIDKTNSYTVDPASGVITSGFSDAGQGRKINGLELGLSGKITDQWSVYLAYAYLDGKVTRLPGSSGNEAPSVPRNNLSLWTSYDIPGSIANLPGTFTIGGGFQYASAYWADTANTARMPQTFSLDAMVSYKFDRFRVSVNAYNLTDHRNYSSAFNASRAVPASGRTVMLNLGATF